MKLDFLERHILNPNYETVWVGYSTFNLKRVVTSNYGIWLGYKKGKLFADLRFRQTIPKEKFGKDIWTHFKSLTVLFDKMWPVMSNPPLVLISSKKAVDFLKQSKYKWAGVEHKAKTKIFFWMDSLTPAIESYDAMVAPFSLLRELMFEEGKRVSEKTFNKDFFDYSELNRMSVPSQVDK